jgi:predicted acetyltransferase
MPRLILPTTSVRASYLTGETETALEEGIATSWLVEAATDFAGFVEQRRTVRELWGVPVTELWYVEGSEYIGTVVIRHHLTPELERDGGHVGYHVVPRRRRRGHATRMLAKATAVCRDLGLGELLITCNQHNLASRRVIEHNGGTLQRIVAGQAHYRLSTAPPDPGTGAGAALL